MIKLYFLATTMILEFITMLFQLSWMKPMQIQESLELGENTVDAFFERGVLGITCIIFIVTTGALAYVIFKMIKDQRAQVSDLIETHREDSKEISLVFSTSIDKTHDIIMKHAKNEAIQTELMRDIKEFMIKNSP